MIPSYTRQYLGMNVCASTYFLPFEVDVKDDEIMEKTMKLFTDTNIYERELYADRGETPLSVKDNEITMKCLYEGSDDYYEFSARLIVFRLNDEKKIHDKKWMVAMYIEHCYGGLLHELIDLKTIPRMIKSLGLGEFSYFS